MHGLHLTVDLMKRMTSSSRRKGNINYRLEKSDLDVERWHVYRSNRECAEDLRELWKLKELDVKDENIQKVIKIFTS